jgi:hypothetical protein
VIDTLSCVYDPPFIFAPSYLLAEQMAEAGELLEGKALGTAKMQDLSLLRDMVTAKDADPEKFAAARKVGADVGRRKLKQVQARVKKKFVNLIKLWDEGEINEPKFRKEATRVMKTAWRDVFLAGVRAGGTAPPPYKRPKGSPLVTLLPGDDKWLKSAMKHEMQFLNAFLRAIIDDTGVMPYERRVGMYVDALSSFFDSARVISLPNNSVIHWSGPRDKVTCASCEFLFRNNPYATATLPTTPRAGMTICLTNCRDWLYIRRVDPAQAQTIADESAYTRGGLIKKLRRIKRLGHE